MGSLIAIIKLTLECKIPSVQMESLYTHLFALTFLLQDHIEKLALETLVNK